MSGALRLEEAFIHLGPGAAAIAQPPFDGMRWYEGYVARHGGDGAEGRLVSQHRFDADWQSWEMHPAGAEVVICTAGRMTLWQEGADGSLGSVVLGPGDYAINAPGIWHTADVAGSATAIFITAGGGTMHRPRETA